MNIQVRNIPEDLHRQFKTLVVSEGSSLQQTLVRLMREYVEKGGKAGDQRQGANR